MSLRTTFVVALIIVTAAISFSQSAGNVLSSTGVVAYSLGRKSPRLVELGPLSGSYRQSSLPTVQDSQEISVQYYSPTGVSLDQISTGAVGDGWLVYYLPANGVQKPSIVVHLTKTAGDDLAYAKVFAAPAGASVVPIRIRDNQIELALPSQPAVTIASQDGWWVRDGLVSYNLDIQVDGPVYSMWGGGYDPKFGATGWTALIQGGQPAVSIQVRDPDHRGIPRWELRTLLPAFPGRAYYRTNYAEQECNTPTTIDPGPSPLWPYVAYTGVFEQASGQLRPPIVVNWVSGQITHFSELVTVRNQNCSYALYSLDPVKPGLPNHPDFESPFAFYDLSGQGLGLPNLILRTERYPMGDIWAAGLDPQSPNSQLARDFQTVRYSWRDAVGDQRLDYKVETLGFYPYGFQTPIADGLATIDAPSYQQMPRWVVSHPWPIVTFVDPESINYVSTEGIYDWSPRLAGVPFALGRQDQPAADAFTQIGAGLRGEYRLDRDLQPWLYFSPIDNRLHLLGANGGLWNLGNNHQIRSLNLDGDQFINGWVREATAPGTDAKPIEALYALPGYLLYSGPQGVTLRQANYMQDTFTILPPIDHDTWLAFVAKVEPLRAAKRDPSNLASWLAGAPGQDQILTGIGAEDVLITPTGFRFTLDIWPGYKAQGNFIPGLPGLNPGQYVVNYDGAFVVTPLIAAQPVVEVSSLRASPTSATALESMQVTAVLGNAGTGDLHALTVQLLASGPGHVTQIITTSVALLAGQPVPVHFDWTPPQAGEWLLQLSWTTAGGAPSAAPASLGELTVQVQPRAALGATALWALSNGGNPLAEVLLLAGVMLSGAALAVAMARRARGGT